MVFMKRINLDINLEVEHNTFVNNLSIVNHLSTHILEIFLDIKTIIIDIINKN